MTTAERWNALAEKYNLPKVREVDPAREQQLAGIVFKYPGWWEDLEDALATRSDWAREHRFPSFDQATNHNTFLRLTEGFYAKPGKIGEALVRKVDRQMNEYWGRP